MAGLLTLVMAASLLVGITIVPMGTHTFAKSSAIKMISKKSFKKKLSKADKKIKSIRKNITVIKKSDTFIPGKTYTGTAYYVSANGNDEDTGLSEDHAWKSIPKVASYEFSYGDIVLFRRGDVFRGSFEGREGVTYSAYGKGRLPRIFGCTETGVGEEKWTFYGNTSDGGKVWVFYCDMTDIGTIHYGGDKKIGTKVAPYWGKDGFVFKDGREFSVLKGLKKNLSFFSEADSKLPREDVEFLDTGSAMEYCGTSGKLYVRCDKGNPGKLYKSIEFATTTNGQDPLVNLHDNSVINNLDMRYSSNSCVCEGNNNCVVQNCEISYSGGYVCYYAKGKPCLAGDGVVGKGKNNTIRNCYIHDNGDFGITIETGYNGIKESSISDLLICGNVINHHAKGALQFMSFKTFNDADTSFKNIKVKDNYFFNDTKGWSFPVRTSGDVTKGVRDYYVLFLGDEGSELKSKNMVFRNNVFYNVDGMCIGGSLKDRNVRFKGNTFLFTGKRKNLCVLAYPASSKDGAWCWADGSGTENGITLLNKKLGSKNKIFIRKKK